MFKAEFEDSRFYSQLKLIDISALAKQIRKFISSARIKDIKELFEEIKNIYSDPEKSNKTPIEAWFKFINKEKSRSNSKANY